MPAGRGLRSSALEILLLLGFFVMAAGAQNLNSMNIFAGYSFTGTNVFSQHANLNGWNLSLEKRYLPFFGMVLDFSGHYGSTGILDTDCTTTSPTGCLVNSTVSEHLFQFGVRGGYAAPRFRPFAQLLFGAAVIDQNGPGVSNLRSSFAETFGAGIDFRINRRLAWRLDADMVQTGSFVSRNSSLRASTGLVAHF